MTEVYRGYSLNPPRGAGRNWFANQKRRIRRQENGRAIPRPPNRGGAVRRRPARRRQRRRLPLVRNAMSAPLSQCLESFKLAVTNPFAEGALGAIYPDGKVPASAGFRDRLTADFEPGQWATAGMTSISGVLVWMQPRCSGSQMTFNIPGNTLKQVQCNPVEDAVSFTTVSVLYPGSANFVPFTTWSRTICMAVLGVSPGSALPRWHLLNSGVLGVGFNSILMDHEAANLTINFSTGSEPPAVRLLGAGLRMFAETPPISTGGTVYSGWCTTHDLGRIIKNNFAVEPVIYSRAVNQGTQGATCRYSCLQSDQQLEYVAEHDISRYLATLAISAPYIQVGIGAENDQIAPGLHLPMIYWRFDKAADATTHSSLRIEAVTHSQIVPNALFPYSTFSERVEESILEELVDDLEDVIRYPISGPYNNTPMRNVVVRPMVPYAGRDRMERIMEERGVREQIIQEYASGQTAL